MIDHALVCHGEMSRFRTQTRQTYNKHHLHQSPGQGDVFRMMLNKDIEYLTIMAY